MEIIVNDLIDVLSSEIGESKELKTVTNFVLKHPLIRDEYKNMKIEDIGLLIYGVYFVSNGRKLETLHRLRENIVFYIICYFEYCDSRYITCPSCYGNAEQECRECDGLGEIECDKCDGIGSNFSSNGEIRNCYICNGDGQVECSECDGEGKQNCSECDGVGEIEDGDECGYTSYLYMSILPLSIIEKMKQSDGILTTEFDEEINEIHHLTTIFAKDEHSYMIGEDNSDWNDVEENAEMFYQTVDGEIRLKNVSYPVFD